MSSSLCEPPDEPGPCESVENDLSSLQRQFSTEQFYIARCDVGAGVFANRDIAPGEVILRLEGPRIDFAETKRRGQRECMAIQIGYNNYIDTQPPGVFVNHSCDPNAGIRRDRYLVALREIRKGQEIRYDYSTTMEEQSFTMNCLCGAPTCRKVVRDFSTLPRPVQQRYISQGIVMSFILRRLGLGAVRTGLGTARANLAFGAPALAGFHAASILARAGSTTAFKPAKAGAPAAGLAPASEWVGA